MVHLDTTRASRARQNLHIDLIAFLVRELALGKRKHSDAIIDTANRLPGWREIMSAI
jgi:hypothetical protein